ncbi:hypothetical protein Pelo_103 [Pelomyxa schiedti]|nr:hypothetical protein Pelo_103 [Pelomyxa schiedti]
MDVDSETTQHRDDPTRSQYAFNGSTFSGCRRVLVVGLGGGCDAITAYVFAHTFVKPFLPPTCLLSYGDTKDGPVDTSALSPVVCDVAALGGSPPSTIMGTNGASTTTSSAPNTGGSTLRCSRYLWKMITNGLISTGLICYRQCPRRLRYYQILMTLPRVEQGFPSPVIFMLPETEEPNMDVAAELSDFGFDCVIGVDAGGDSLTDTNMSGDQGRDKKAVEQLLGKRSHRRDYKFFHVVAGMGCDGESTKESILAAFRKHTQAGTYLGCLELAPMVTLLRGMASWLPQARTPHIISNAITNPQALSAPGYPITLASDFNQPVVIPRCLNPVIPLRWLQLGFVFTV